MSAALDLDTAYFLKHALAQGHELKSVLQAPDAVAGEMGVRLTESQRSAVQKLNMPVVTERFTTLSPEAHSFIREVVKDGRYLADWKTHPEEVGRRIGVNLEPEFFDEIREIDLSDVLEPGDPMVMRVGAVTIISVAVAVIVTASGMENDITVIDFSRLEKL